MIKSAPPAVTVLLLTLVLGGFLREQKKRAAAALAEPARVKRLAWTGEAMQRAGFKEETVKRALTQGGTVVAWGGNDEGRTAVPAGLSGVVAIAAGSDHTVALKLPK